MRKAAALLLAMALILSLFACGNESEQPAPDSDIQQGTVILPKPPEETNPDPTENRQPGWSFPRRDIQGTRGFSRPGAPRR